MKKNVKKCKQSKKHEPIANKTTKTDTVEKVADEAETSLSDEQSRLAVQQELASDLAQLTQSLKQNATVIQSILQREDAEIAKIWRPCDYRWILESPLNFTTFIVLSLLVTAFLPFLLYYGVFFVSACVEDRTLTERLDWAVRWHAGESNAINYYYWVVPTVAGLFAFVFCTAVPGMLLIEDMIDAINASPNDKKNMDHLSCYCKYLRLFFFTYVMCYLYALACQLLFNIDQYFTPMKYGNAYIALTTGVTYFVFLACKRIFFAAFNEHVMEYESSGLAELGCTITVDSVQS